MSNQLFKLLTRHHFRFINKVSFNTCIKNYNINPQEPICMKLLQAFWKKEDEWEQKVNLNALSDTEKIIYQFHRQACKAGQVSYRDPETGYLVFTRLKHFMRNKCCGNACRHCPYDHVNVPMDKKKTKRFNSAFYVNDNSLIRVDSLTNGKQNSDND